MANQKSEDWSKSALAAKQALDRPLPGVKHLVDTGTKIVLNAQSGKPWCPKEGKTFCNFAVDAGASEYGFMGFHDASRKPLMANEIINVMAAKGSGWVLSTAQDAYHAALRGDLAVATYSEAPHGHVAIVAPGGRVWSQKWNNYAPPVFNVGKTVADKAPWTMGANFAFMYQPNYYVFVGV